MSTATRSGNPAKKAAAKKKVSTAADFKRRAKGVELELPSGLVVRARRVSVQDFVVQGNIPNPLMEVVSEALEKGKQADVPKMMGVEDGKVDLSMVQEMMMLVDAIVVASVQEPKVHEMPENSGDMDDDLVYINDIDLEDRMFLFQWNTGGTADIESFRKEARASLDALATGEGGVDSTE